MTLFKRKLRHPAGTVLLETPYEVGRPLLRGALVNLPALM
jgi:hypothetical protein